MRRQHGLSIVELLVSITVGLIIILGATMTFVPIATATRESVASSKMNTDVRAILDLITNELRRAGYNTNDKIKIANNNSCIIYPYVETMSKPPTVQWHGIRHLNNIAQLAQNLNPNTTDCTTSGAWQPLNDHRTIQITKLEFRCDDQHKIAIHISTQTQGGHKIDDLEIVSKPRNTNCE